MIKYFINEKISLEELSKIINIEKNDILKNIFLHGINLKKNELINFNFIKNLCKNIYNIDLFKKNNFILKTSNFNNNYIFISIFGNVNSGKTTLLDFIMKKNISYKEIGKITQFVNIYEFFFLKKKIFLFDLPGHELFHYIINNIIKICNLLFLLIPVENKIDENLEKILEISKKNNCEIIICINKIDKKNYLNNLNVSYKKIKISSKNGYGIKNLLNEILKENIFKNKIFLNSGIIINSYYNNNNFITTLLLLKDTFNNNDTINFNNKSFFIKDIFFEKNNNSVPCIIKVKNFIFPIEFYFNINKKNNFLNNEVYKEKYFKLENFFIKTDNFNIGISLKFFYENLKNNEKINILNISLGNINDNDINYCLLFKCKIITIGINLNSYIKKKILKNNIWFKNFFFLHELINYFKNNYLINKKEIVFGTALVKAIFPSGKGKKIAGCKMIDGEIKIENFIKIYNNLKLIFKGKIENIKINNFNVNKVNKNNEFGIIIKNFNDIEINYKIISINYIDDK